MKFPPQRARRRQQERVRGKLRHNFRHSSPKVGTPEAPGDELVQIACNVIAKASRANPADAVLRLELIKRQKIDPAARRWITESVFSYYRWYQWLDRATSVADQLRFATELQNRFDREGSNFTDPELLQKAIPEWTAKQIEVTADWVRSLQTKPVLWLRAKIGNEHKITSDLGGCSSLAEIPTTLRYNGDEDLFRSPLFHAGEFELQDISSQLVGHLCAAAPNETWWDACAGEGGKLLHLSDLMGNKGLIWASDRAGWRLQSLKRRAARAKAFNYRVAPWDGGAKLPTKTKFDGVLVDAPCSGVGTWQRNPHARWTTSLDDVLELKELQIRLLLHTSAAVKPGGRLIYAVCTITRAETVEVATRVEQELTAFKPLMLHLPLTGKESAQYCIWPQEFAGNGMFVAAWQRTD